MLEFSAAKLAATSVQYSPYIDNRLALGASANFGIVGNGKVFCLEIASNGMIHAAAAFDTQDSVYDVAWSEVHENHVVAGCGDGSIQLFDCTRAQHPLIVHKEHNREVFDIDWNVVNKHQYCSCSWDGTIKLWSASGNLKSLTTLTSGPGVIYQAKYSPHSANLIASAGADGSVRLWDTRNGQPSLAFNGPAGSGECMTVDWNKYRPQTVASAGSDGAIRIWDLRNSAQLVNELRGHQLAVKSVKWSPHSAHHLLSASYDMTAKVWTDNQLRAVPAMGPRGLVTDFKRHTEFVTDCDWSLWGEPGWVATASFDSNVYIWKTQS